LVCAEENQPAKKPEKRLLTRKLRRIRGPILKITAKRNQSFPRNIPGKKGKGNSASPE
jgi:hypothetical protein